MFGRLTATDHTGIREMSVCPLPAKGKCPQVSGKDHHNQSMDLIFVSVIRRCGGHTELQC